ncbi:MAG: citrate synthase [Opitutales bacterium]|jgi:citrate synthase|nr:citrate synthase [Opitutales bacterium]MDP4884540.1 citrate synthase [Opitutales bacterium]MDP4884654.1 citrate synthase [Opitutales bacterium]
METTGTIRLGNENFEFPIIEGTEGEKALDIRTLRAKSGHIMFDEGYGNTGSCLSQISFIDGEKGILRHRGYPIEQLAEQSTFLEAAMLVIYGELPKSGCLDAFRNHVRDHASIHTGMHHHFDGFPSKAHPMAILSAMLNSLGAYYPEMSSNDREQDLVHFDETAALLISKVRTIAAMTYRMKQGLPFVFPDRNRRYAENFLHMMFSEPYNTYIDSCGAADALDLFLLLHADHEQNCSTSTVRMVASGGANLFASVSAGVCALWGPSHGGANMAVIQMLEEIHAAGDDGSRFIEDAKNGKAKLMGFGHRVYKNYDPRAKILGKSAEHVLSGIGIDDPLLDIAKHLEQAALEDDYFVKRKLYPNVDFYSGILLKAIGIPVEMFTVMFAIGRMPGWIANWKEIAENPKSRIHRPRQVYTGEPQRDFVKLGDR